MNAKSQRDLRADVVVCGGGPAGMAAAWAAAAGGADTLLVEAGSCLGGAGTVGGVSMFVNWKGEVDGKIADLSGRFYRRLMQALDGCGGRYPKDEPECNSDFVEIEDVKRHAERLLVEAGVKILYDTRLAGCERTGVTVRGVRLLGKGLDAAVACRALIDCTGDADACRLAGAETVFGHETLGRCQPMTMIFAVSGVDTAALRRDYRGKPGVFSDAAGHVWLGGGFRDELEAAARDGAFAGPYHPAHVSMIWSAPKSPSTVFFNVTKVWDADGSDAAALSAAQIEGRRQVEEFVGVLRRYFPGFAGCSLADTYRIGVRETYRLAGRHTLTEQDVLGGVTPEDSVALCAAVMDSHLACNQATTDWNNRLAYGIPYRCMLPKTIKGLLAAGRCLSGTHLAAGSYRHQGTCMTTGEAAGKAAALALTTRRDVSELDGREMGVISQ